MGPVLGLFGVRQESSRGARSPGRRLQSSATGASGRKVDSHFVLYPQAFHFRPAERPGPPASSPAAPGRAVLRGALPLQRLGSGWTPSLGAAPAPLRERGPHSGLRAPLPGPSAMCAGWGASWEPGGDTRALRMCRGQDASPLATCPAPPQAASGPPGAQRLSRAGPPLLLCPRSLSLSSLAKSGQAPRTLQDPGEVRSCSLEWASRECPVQARGRASSHPEPAPRHAHTVPCAPPEPCRDLASHPGPRLCSLALPQSSWSQPSPRRRAAPPRCVPGRPARREPRLPGVGRGRLEPLRPGGTVDGWQCSLCF